VFLRLAFVAHFLAKRNMLQQECLKGQIRTCLLGTVVQLLALYTNPESHNAQRHRQTDGQTDDRMMPIADHSVLQYDRLIKRSKTYNIILHSKVYNTR